MKTKTLLIKSAFILSAIIALPILSGAQTIAAGGFFSVAICSDNTVKTWGYNEYGQLGNGTLVMQSVTPVQVSSLTGIIAVSAGWGHAIALKNDGTVWAWGYNYRGQLGNGTSGVGTDSNIPVQVSSLTGIVAIAAGGNHSMALRNDSTVWVWGELYIGNNTLPVQVTTLTGIKAIAAGDHSLALKNDSTVWAWGKNTYGQLGNGTLNGAYTPVKVNSLTSVVAIDGSQTNSLALLNDGTVWAWGKNDYGQLGNGSNLNSTTPVQVNSLSGIVAIAGGRFYHSLALKNDGTLMAWGWNPDGELGDGSLTDRNQPVPVNSLTGVKTITAGGRHSLALKNNGTVWAWGSNSSGQLGAITGGNNVLIQTNGLCQPLIGINEITEKASLSIFPNPTNGQFTISLEDIKFQKSGAELEIYNVIGEKVYSEKVQNQKTVTLNLDEPNGIYFITLKSGEQNYYQKLIKQ